jgi:spore coat polysaccharide biosynthesis protein SpsF
MTIGAIVQARTSSTRLPKKVLKELPYGSHITVLQQVIRRLKRSKKITDIIIATTTDLEDKAIVKVAQNEKVKWFRGSKEDVLSRYYLAAKQNKLDTIVRITSDCPCIDPAIVDTIIGKHLSTKSDYTANTLTRTFPHGLDTEVFNFVTLEKTFSEAKQDYEREHVTPYIYKTRPDLFQLNAVKAPKRLQALDIRVTLDTEEDYVLLCAIFDYLFPRNKFFSAEAIIGLFKRKPWLKLINKNAIQKQISMSADEEIKEAMKIFDFQGLRKAKRIFQESLQ